MYYPYLKGHEFELRGLCELAPEIVKSAMVMPIIEPADTDILTVGSLKEYKGARMPFILVTNPPGLPRAKEFLSEIYSSILSGCTCCKMGMIITGQTLLVQVEEFIKRFRKSELCLIHFGNYPDPKALASLIGKTPAIGTQVFIEERISKKYLLEVDMNTRTVVISDPISNCFQGYKAASREFFSRYHALYIQSGFDGFGDFLFTGDLRRELHIGKMVYFPYYRKKSDEIWVRRFVLDAEGNPNGFLKIIEFIKSLPAYTRTESLQEFLAFYGTGCCPDGETSRKILLKHYIELMIKCIGRKLHSV